jgi:hypothetical protein
MAILIGIGVQSGCREVAGYPETTVPSPHGRPGVCFSCRKAIDSVTDENLMTVDGIRFTVCSNACAKKAEGAAHGHSH